MADTWAGVLDHEVLRYVRTRAQAGAEQAAAVRNVAYAVLQTPVGNALHRAMVEQFRVAVEAHVRYLAVLHQTLWAADDEEDV